MGFYGFKQGRTSRVVERLKVYLILKNFYVKIQGKKQKIKLKNYFHILFQTHFNFFILRQNNEKENTTNVSYFLKNI